MQDDEETMEEILGLRRSEQKDGNGKLAAQVNAVAVLDMIKSLQEEIKVGSWYISLLNFTKMVESKMKSMGGGKGEWVSVTVHFPLKKEQNMY